TLIPVFERIHDTGVYRAKSARQQDLVVVQNGGGPLGFLFGTPRRSKKRRGGYCHCSQNSQERHFTKISPKPDILKKFRSADNTPLKTITGQAAKNSAGPAWEARSNSPFRNGRHTGFLAHPAGQKP
mgnify:CR=1